MSSRQKSTVEVTPGAVEIVVWGGPPGPPGEPGSGIQVKGVAEAWPPADAPEDGDLWVIPDPIPPGTPEGFEPGDGASWDGENWVNTGPIQGPPGEDGGAHIVSETAPPPGDVGDLWIRTNAPEVEMPAGPPGPPGTAATIEVAETVTIDPGYPAEVVNLGNANKALLSFKIPQGIPGVDGAPGPAGVDGVQGIPGEVGPEGPQGEPGPQGIQGEPGSDGAPGVDGAPGPAGEPGKDGIDGSDGEPGPVGPQGEPGAVGPEGPQGIQGIPGIQGAPGLGITYRGNVATVDDLPDTAAQGDLWTVAEPAPAHGFVWDEDAYDWVDAGPVQGPQGVAGPQGVQGPAGEPGAVGSQGPQGIPGEAGPAGPAGIQGERGEPGIPGEVGPEGPAGVQGETGPAGPTAIATDTVLGGVKIGAGITVTADGTISAAAGTDYVLPKASATVLGGIKIGAGLSIDANGVCAASLAGNYVNKAGDVMNGPLRYAPNAGPAGFNGTDVYTYYDGAYYRLYMPGGRQAFIAAPDTAQVQFLGANPQTPFTPADDKDLANKKYVDGAVSSAITGATQFLKTTGGTMTGTIVAPTAVNTMTWATSYNIFGSSGGVAFRNNNANLLLMTTTSVAAVVLLEVRATGAAIRFGSAGPTVTNVSGVVSITANVESTTAAPTAASHLTRKDYVDGRVIAQAAGGAAPAVTGLSAGTLWVEY
jgi:hypothetical protein